VLQERQKRSQHLPQPHPPPRRKRSHSSLSVIARASLPGSSFAPEWSSLWL
jgi:hypothetical protein